MLIEEVWRDSKEVAVLKEVKGGLDLPANSEGMLFLLMVLYSATSED